MPIASPRSLTPAEAARGVFPHRNRCLASALLALGCAKVLGFQPGEPGAKESGEAALGGTSQAAGALTSGAPVSDHAGAGGDASGGEAGSANDAGTGPCGNQQLDTDEECDGEELRGATCASVRNGAGGTLRCRNCEYDLSECYHVRSLDVSSHACAVLTNDKLKCWGANRSGQLGLGDTSPRGEEGGEMGANLPFVDLGGRRVLEVSTGSDHTCARVEGNQVVCWGSNFYGQLGEPEVDEVLGPSPEAKVELGEGTIVQVAAGGNHTCALFDTGQMKCWGNNQHGQLGLGHDQSRGGSAGEMANLPFIDLGHDTLGAPLKVKAIAAGADHTCAFTTSATVKCWGSNSDGLLGIGNYEENRGEAPNELGDDLPAVNIGTWSAEQLVAGGRYNCVTNVSHCKCWGSNNDGQLGIGAQGSRGSRSEEMGDALANVDLGDLSAVGLSAGYSHTCAWSALGEVKCWGSNFGGELGLGDLDSRGNLPGQMGQSLPFVDLGRDQKVRSIHAGDNMTCAILDPGRVKCWGLNNEVRPIGVGHSNSVGVAADQMGDALPFVEL